MRNDVPLKDVCLSARDLEVANTVLKVSMRGGTLLDAADELGVRKSTVTNSLSTVYREVGVRNLLGFVVWAHRTRVINLDEL